jgi:hypothetical protein
VLPVAPETTDGLVNAVLVEDSQLYAYGAVPPEGDVAEPKALGLPPTQMVWEPEISPGNRGEVKTPVGVATEKSNEQYPKTASV